MNQNTALIMVLIGVLSICDAGNYKIRRNDINWFIHKLHVITSTQVIVIDIEIE